MDELYLIKHGQSGEKTVMDLLNAIFSIEKCFKSASKVIFKSENLKLIKKLKKKTMLRLNLYQSFIKNKKNQILHFR
jgi:hypothetical protein